MITPEAPIPQNEMMRLIALTELDLDYSDLEQSLKDLNRLAANVAGAPISLVNFIDTFTQWTVSSNNLPAGQSAREDSACQYTIMQQESFEVKDLSVDDRFKDRSYVTGDPHYRYYFGVPLKTQNGLNVGALCVLDYKKREISPEKIELLKIIAKEIMSRLATTKLLESLKTQVKDAQAAKNSIAHDIRGPLSGIMSLAEVVSQQGKENKIDDILQFVKLIYKSSHSLLQLAEEILSNEKSSNKELESNQLNLLTFKQTLEKLYEPQALNKKIDYSVNIADEAKDVPFRKNKLLQITGNLISNAIKFTPENGTIKVDLKLIVRSGEPNVLSIWVVDSGVGIDAAIMKEILDGSTNTTKGTSGEKGYGFGLALVKHLVESLSGTIEIESVPQAGTSFKIYLPQKS